MSIPFPFSISSQAYLLNVSLNPVFICIRLSDGTGGENNGTLPEFDSCGICGVGKSIRLLDATIEVPDDIGLPVESGGFTCQMAETYCKSGGCNPETCGAFANGLSSVCGCEDSVTVVDVIAADDALSSLASFATIAGLLDTLSAADDITILAPDNDAFTLLADDYPNLGAEKWSAHLEDFLKHHVLPEKLTSSEITDGLNVETLNGEDIEFLVNKNARIFINGKIRVENADAVADNGVVHTIEAVLNPAWVKKSTADVVGEISNLSTLKGFVAQANLAGDLSGEGTFTVFAPTDAAIQAAIANFANIAGITVEALDDATTLKMILEQHIVSGVNPAASLSDGLELTALSQDKLTIALDGDSATVNGFKIVSTDNLANNGIVHLIDGLLIPPTFALPPGGPSVGQPGGPTVGIGGDIGSAATQSCSICSGVVGTGWNLMNPDAMITIPEGFTISTIQSTEATCTLVEQACQLGYCSAETCTALFESAPETCGCVVP